METKIKVLIVDDEEPARLLLRNYLADNDHFEIAGECENGFEALKAVKELQPKLLLLDVQMPRINGLELLEVLDPCPEIIFTTAYDRYAIKAFEMNAVDYLMKPFSRDRLNIALEKAMDRITSPQSHPGKQPVQKLMKYMENENEEISRIICRKGSKLIVIPVDTIHYIEAQDDYVMIHSDQGSFLKEQRMKYYEMHLCQGYFVRVHRSFIANIMQIAAVEKYGKESFIAIMKNGEQIKVSMAGYKKLKALL